MKICDSAILTGHLRVDLKVVIHAIAIAHGIDREWTICELGPLRATSQEILGRELRDIRFRVQLGCSFSLCPLIKMHETY